MSLSVLKTNIKLCKQNVSRICYKYINYSSFQRAGFNRLMVKNSCILFFCTWQVTKKVLGYCFYQISWKKWSSGDIKIKNVNCFTFILSLLVGHLAVLTISNHPGNPEMSARYAAELLPIRHRSALRGAG